MKGSKAFLLILLTCLLHQSFALNLPNLLSSFTRRLDPADDTPEVEEAEDSSDGEAKEEQAGKYPTTTTHRPTRPPLFPAIPHPADTPLNPLTNPNHPLHPDNLPTLPSLPQLPPLPPLPQFPSFPHRETIHATKTVYVEVTDRVTIHPVCMTAYKVTHPCLPYDPHHHHQDQWGGLKEDDIKQEEIRAQEASVIKPSAVVELEPSRFLGPESIGEAAEIPVVESLDDIPATREARYVELTPSIPQSAEKVEIKDAPVEHAPTPAPPAGSPLDVVHNLLHNPVTHYKTKTLWVTKVEKILDTRVTATLVAKNCIPTNSHIPVCAAHGGLVGPGYHGHLAGQGIYTESYGGHIVAGHVHTEKHQSGYHPEADVVEQIHADKQQKEETDRDNETEQLDVEQ